MNKKSRLELRVTPGDKAAWTSEADVLRLTVSDLIRQRMNRPSSPSATVEVTYDADEVAAWEAEAASLGTTLEGLVRLRMTPA